MVKKSAANSTRQWAHTLSCRRLHLEFLSSESPLSSPGAAFFDCQSIGETYAHDDRLQHVERPSGHTYTFTRQPNDTTDIDVVVVRDGTNLKGRLLGLVLGTIGRRVLERAFGKAKPI